MRTRSRLWNPPGPNPDLNPYTCARDAYTTLDRTPSADPSATRQNHTPTARPYTSIQDYGVWYSWSQVSKDWFLSGVPDAIGGEYKAQSTRHRHYWQLLHQLACQAGEDVPTIVEQATSSSSMVNPAMLRATIILFYFILLLACMMKPQTIIVRQWLPSHGTQ